MREGILEPVQPVGVTNTSPVVWQWKKNGALRLCVDLNFQSNDKLIVEYYQIPDMETIFHNLLAASIAYYQIELDEDATKQCTINKSQGLYKICRLPQGLKKSSSVL